jgi:methyltransferase (TIGR00027 family)
MKIASESFAGVGTSATRVIELYYPEDKRLFDDPLALKLLPFWWQVVLRLVYLPGLRSLVLSLRERRMPGSLGSILCRTRYLDDVLKRSLAEGVEQVVILGAGFDSRAYRIPGMNQVQVFEVDLPGTRELKRARLENVLGAVPENVALIGMNFDQQTLDDTLGAAGFQKEKRTLFIWEGVTQYITAEAVDNTLGFVSHVAGAGSAIVFTYVRRGIVDGSDRPEWMGPFLSFARMVGSPMIFGLDQGELEQFLSERGLKLMEDVGADEYQELYLMPIDRELNVFDGERAVLAEVMGERSYSSNK